MQPTGILRNSKNSRLSKQRKSVSWGMLYAQADNREQSVSSIPLTSFKEIEALNKIAERDYFGLVDLSGLENSRRRATTSIEEMVFTNLPFGSPEDSAGLEAVGFVENNDLSPSRRRNSSRSLSEFDSDECGSEPLSPVNHINLATSRRPGSMHCSLMLT